MEDRQWTTTLRLLFVIGILFAFLSCFPSESAEIRVRIPLEGEISIPYPRNISGHDLFQVSTQIYETLVTLDAAGRIVPALASSWEFDSEALYLELRRGVLFHNQKELTSAHVVSSLSNLKDASSALIPEAQGPYRVRIPLSNLGSQVLFLLSSPAFAIYSTETFFGTGPFRFSYLSATGTVILEKFSNYWMPGMPLVDKLEFHGSIQGPSQIQGFLNDDFDVLEVKSPGDRAVLRASELARFEIFGGKEFVVALNLRNFSVDPSTGTYDFRRAFLVQDGGIVP